MTESKFLAGKVLKWSLPVAEAPTGAFSLKRLLLPQGELARIYDADEGVRFIAYIELRAGSVRGNHYHKTKEEFVYIIQGEVALLLQDLESKVRESVPLRAGDLVFIQTGIAHALQTLQSGQAIEFSKNRFDPEDNYRSSLT